MLDDIRNTAGDLLSGKMKDERIALTKQESDLLRLKVEGLQEKVRSFEDERIPLIKELEMHRLKVAEQSALIADLTAKLHQRKGVDDRLEEPTHKILNLLFNVTEGLSLSSVRSQMGMTEGVTMFHLDTLMGLDFIGCTRGKNVLMASSGSFMPNQIGKDPDKYHIKPKGRAYIMKNG